MNDYQRAIAGLRAIEIERELTASEEARLIGLLRCAAEDEDEQEAGDDVLARQELEELDQ